MATLKLEISTRTSDETLTRNFEKSDSQKYPVVQACSDLLESVLSGNQLSPVVDVSVEENEVHASSTFTMTSVIATDACSINGVSFVCSAGAPSTNQFQVGSDDDETADNLVNAINGTASALVANYVTAEKTSSAASPAVVKITAKRGGIDGNTITIATADATIVVPGARLTGGAPDPSAKSYSF